MTTTPIPQAGTRVPVLLDHEERALIVDQLRARAEQITAEAVRESVDVAAAPADRDRRPAAVRLAGRLALVAQLQDLAQRITEAAR